MSLQTVSTRLATEDCSKLRQYARKVGFQSVAALLRSMIISRLSGMKSTESTSLVEESIDYATKIRSSLSEVLENFNEVKK